MSTLLPGSAMSHLGLLQAPKSNDSIIKIEYVTLSFSICSRVLACTTKILLSLTYLSLTKLCH